MFTAQHYRALADWLRDADVDPRSRQVVSAALAQKLSQDNHRFDRRRWLKDAGAWVEPQQLELCSM